MILQKLSKPSNLHLTNKWTKTFWMMTTTFSCFLFNWLVSYWFLPFSPFIFVPYYLIKKYSLAQQCSTRLKQWIIKRAAKNIFLLVNVLQTVRYVHSIMCYSLMCSSFIYVKRFFRNSCFCFLFSLIIQCTGLQY